MSVSDGRQSADVWPVRVKSALMRLPWPVWKRLVFPLWRRWYLLWLRLPVWQTGSYKAGQVAYWHGVRLICCTGHYAGSYAEHPWDPGHGWEPAKAAALWEPATPRHRLLLRLVGDPRRTQGTECA